MGEQVGPLPEEQPDILRLQKSVPESVKNAYASRPLPKTPKELAAEKEKVLQGTETLRNTIFPEKVSGKGFPRLHAKFMLSALCQGFQKVAGNIAKEIQKSREGCILNKIRTLFKKDQSDLSVEEETESLLEADEECDTALYAKEKLSDEEMHDRKVLSNQFSTKGLSESRIEEQAIPIKTKNDAIRSLELRKEAIEEKQNQIADVLSKESVTFEEMKNLKLFGETFYHHLDTWNANYQKFINKIQQGAVVEELEEEIDALLRSGGEESTKPVSQKEIDSLTPDQKLTRAAKYVLEWYQKHELEVAIDQCDKAIEWSETRTYDYVSSFDPQNDVEQGRYKVGEEVSTELANLYMQSVKVDEENECTFFREGALGSGASKYEVVSLPELLAIRQNPKGDAYNRLIKRLERQEKKKLIQAQGEAIQELKSILKEGDVDKLDALIRKKQFILEQKMVRYVQLQMEAHPELIEGKGTFALLQLSLLRLTERKEFIRADEMDYLFKAFDGKKVLFNEGLETAYLDADGTICMPPPKGVKPEMTVTIKPLLANVSTQHKLVGTLLRRPSSEEARLQNKINRQTLETLLEVIGPDKEKALNLLEECKKDLFENKKSSSEIARKLAMVAYLGDVPLGINCFSGKDRTGVVSYLLDVGIAKHCLQQQNVGAKKLKKRVSDWESETLSAGTIQHKIVRLNNCKWLKVTELLPSGYEKHVMKRIVAGVRVVKD